MSANIRTQRGLTILEVLIASTVFMIGFIIMTFLLGELFSKYSSRDRVIALNLAQKYMEATMVQNEFTDLNDVREESGIAFRIVRKIEAETGLITIRISIIRDSSGKVLVTLYNEKHIT